MNDKLADTLFIRVLPVLLSGAIVWMMTSINDMQIQNARIEQQIVESHKLLTLTSKSIKELETNIVTQKIELSLVKEQVKSLRAEFDNHLSRYHGGGSNAR